MLCNFNQEIICATQVKHFDMFSLKTNLFTIFYVLIHWVQLQIGFSLLEASCTQGKLRCFYTSLAIFPKILVNILFHFHSEKTAKFWDEKFTFQGVIFKRRLLSVITFIILGSWIRKINSALPFLKKCQEEFCWTLSKTSSVQVKLLYISLIFVGPQSSRSSDRCSTVLFQKLLWCSKGI